MRPRGKNTAAIFTGNRYKFRIVQNFSSFSLYYKDIVMQMVFQFPTLRKILMRAGLFMSKTAKTEKGEMVIVILVTFRLLVPLKITI